MNEKKFDMNLLEKFSNLKEKIQKEIKKVIIGQDNVIEEILICMFAKGHTLVTGVPGLAKTLIVKTIAEIMDLEFKRIQFTPDLMPSDIIGTDILEEDQATKKRALKFIKGPIFANIILADEINRTPPKTQSALLESMQEYKVTTGGITYTLDPPFFVLATQNPIEQEGTYPLPEAQLDRFMFNIMIDYPSFEEEKEIIKATTGELLPSVNKVINAEDVLTIQSIVRQIPVSDYVVSYSTKLVKCTRPKDGDSPPFIKQWVSWGCGPRATQYLILGAKTRALLNNSINVSCDDVKAVAKPVLRHRMFTNFNADAEGVTTEDIVDKLLQFVKEPDEKEYL